MPTSSADPAIGGVSMWIWGKRAGVLYDGTDEPGGECRDWGKSMSVEPEETGCPRIADAEACTIDNVERIMIPEIMLRPMWISTPE